MEISIEIPQKTKDRTTVWSSKGFPGGSAVKNPPGNAGDMGSIPGSGRSPREENGNPLQYSSLEKPMDRGAWWATVHGITTVGQNLATKQQQQQWSSNHSHLVVLLTRYIFQNYFLEIPCRQNPIAKDIQVKIIKDCIEITLLNII